MSNKPLAEKNKKRSLKGLRQIKASAGSGKTYELTASFLAALDYCEPDSDSAAPCASVNRKRGIALSELLAITFTNAAASEMRQRIIQRLKEAALGLAADMDSRSAERWLHFILRDMRSLNIRTIDSLLHLIVRSAALELGLNPEFEPEFSTSDLFLPVLERYVDQASADPESRRLLLNAFSAALDYGKIKGFTKGSHLRDRLAGVLEGVLLGKFSDISSREAIQNKFELIQSSVIAPAIKFLDLANKFDVPLHKHARSAFEKYAAGNPEKASPTFATKDSAQDAMTGKNKPFLPELELAYQTLKTSVQTYQECGESLRNGAELLPFIELAKRLVGFFSQTEPVRLPAVLVPSLAAKVIQSENGVPDALCHLGTRLTHFLVDEFQDTSTDQWEVLRSFAEEGLSRGGSLTWVGDVKQSIYGWRGGESQLFDSVKADPGLTAIAPSPAIEILDTNWRSKRVIVNHTNALFSQLADPAFSQEMLKLLVPKSTPAKLLDEMSIRLAQTYNSSEVLQNCAAVNHSDEGYVQAVEVMGDKSETVKDEILSRICHLLNDDIHNRHDWSDILVLCRGNESCRQTAEALIRAGIPVITENSLLLSERSLIVQAQAFLEFLANPRDNLAFWKIISGHAFLEHPAISGLSVQQFVDWATGKDLRQQILYQEFAKDFQQIWKALLEPFVRDGILLAPYDLTREWFSWLDLENRYPEEKVFLARFLEVLHVAENRGLTSVSDFLEYWRGKGQEEKAPLPQNMDAVRIMTIHKAKGLQAPIVIIPGINFNIAPSSKSVVLETAGLRVPGALNSSASGELHYQEYARQAMEAINLLYVAFTRAEDELYFYIPRYSSSNKKNLLPLIDALIEKAGFKLNYAKGTPICGKRCPTEEKDAAKVGSQLAELKRGAVRKTSETWHPMDWLPRLKVFRAHPATSRLTANERGVFIHFCLERLTFHGSPEKDAENAFQHGLRHSGIAVPADSELRKELLKALCWFASLKEAPYWLKKGWPEHTLVDDSGKIMRADLIVPENDGLLIVDYKTGQEYPEHVRQLQDYIACIEKTGQFGGNIRGLIVYLDLQAFKRIYPDSAGPVVEICPEQVPF